jgi:hypothetical protein
LHRGGKSCHLPHLPVPTSTPKVPAGLAAAAEQRSRFLLNLIHAVRTIAAEAFLHCLVVGSWRDGHCGHNPYLLLSTHQDLVAGVADRVADAVGLGARLGEIEVAANAHRAGGRRRVRCRGWRRPGRLALGIRAQWRTHAAAMARLRVNAGDETTGQGARCIFGILPIQRLDSNGQHTCRSGRPAQARRRLAPPPQA